MKGSSFAQYCIKQIQWWSKDSLAVDSGFITFKFMKVSLWFFYETVLPDTFEWSSAVIQNKTKAMHHTFENNKMFQEKKNNTRAVPQQRTVNVFLSGTVHIEIDLTYVASLDNTCGHPVIQPSRVASWLAEHEQPVKRSLILKSTFLVIKADSDRSDNFHIPPSS